MSSRSFLPGPIILRSQKKKGAAANMRACSKELICTVKVLAFCGVLTLCAGFQAPLQLRPNQQVGFVFVFVILFDCQLPTILQATTFCERSGQFHLGSGTRALSDMNRRQSISMMAKKEEKGGKAKKGGKVKGLFT